MPTRLSKLMSKKKSNCNVMKSDNLIISHMTSHVMDLT